MSEDLITSEGINFTDESGETLLFKASLNKDSESVRILLKNGADPNICSNTKQSPLHVASSEGNLEAVKELLRHGANLNTVNSLGQTPLWSACGNGRTEVVIELLTGTNGGADPNIVNKNNRSCLFWPSYYGYLDIVRKLLLAGADPKITDKNKQSPLDMALISGHPIIPTELSSYLPTLQNLCRQCFNRNNIDVSRIPNGVYSAIIS